MNNRIGFKLRRFQTGGTPACVRPLGAVFEPAGSSKQRQPVGSPLSKIPSGYKSKPTAAARRKKSADTIRPRLRYEYPAVDKYMQDPIHIAVGSRLYLQQVSAKGGRPLKFRDLFLPKIAQSDPETRKEAVVSESDIALLKKVIENDSDPEVRRTAQSRIDELSAQA